MKYHPLQPTVGQSYPSNHHDNLYGLSLEDVSLDDLSKMLIQMVPNDTKQFQYNMNAFKGFLSLLQYGDPNMKWHRVTMNHDEIDVEDGNHRPVKLTANGYLIIPNNFNHYDISQVVRALYSVIEANNRDRRRFKIIDV